MQLNGLVKAFLALLAVGAAAVAIGCGSDNDSSNGDSGSSGSSGSDLTFAMVTHGDAGSFWSVVKKGAETAGGDLGVKVNYTESVNDPQKQAQMIEAAISEKVDGIAVSAPDPDAVTPALKKAQQAGIPTVILNAGPPSLVEQVGALEFVGQPEKVAGESVGEKIADEGGNNVLCIIHEQGNVSLEDRCDGVKAGLGGSAEYASQYVKGTQDIATTLTEMQSKLKSDPSIDWVVSLNTEITDALVDAVDAAGSDAKIASFDLSESVLKDVEDGKVQFTVDQQQYLQGYLPIVFMKLYVENKNVVGGGKPVLTGPELVTKENAADVIELSAGGTR